MTIDERLEKLTERHEALTQTVEIVAGVQRENEANIGRLEGNVDRLVGVVESLARITEQHRRRRDDLEGN
jgi:archaellum component FlaC